MNCNTEMWKCPECGIVQDVPISEEIMIWVCTGCKHLFRVKGDTIRMGVKIETLENDNLSKQILETIDGLNDYLGAL